MEIPVDRRSGKMTPDDREIQLEKGRYGLTIKIGTAEIGTSEVVELK